MQRCHAGKQCHAALMSSASDLSDLAVSSAAKSACSAPAAAPSARRRCRASRRRYRAAAKPPLSPRARDAVSQASPTHCRRATDSRRPRAVGSMAGCRGYRRDLGVVTGRVKSMFDAPGRTAEPQTAVDLAPSLRPPRPKPPNRKPPCFDPCSLASSTCPILNRCTSQWPQVPDDAASLRLATPPTSPP